MVLFKPAKAPAMKRFVRCPHCSWTQKTQAAKRVTCFRCNRSFDVSRQRGMEKRFQPKL